MLLVEVEFTQFQKLRSLKKNSGFNGIRTHASPKLVGCFYQLSLEATRWDQAHFRGLFFSMEESYHNL